MKNLLMTIEYDGSAFYGWQKQPDKRTVQGELERVLSILCAAPIAIDGTGRTDAGVHALGQCATFHGDFSIPIENIPGAANNLLSPGGAGAGDVRITSIREVPEGFHARFHAKGKEYRYRIKNSEDVSVFERNYCYRVRKPLDVGSMRQAADYIIGTHDFSSFMAAGGNPVETAVRTVYGIHIKQTEGAFAGSAGAAEAAGAAGAAGAGGPEKEGAALSKAGSDITISVFGDGFLYNMVRIIAGTLVDAGLGKIDPEQMPGIIEGKSRPLAGHTAPARGLYLAKVYFEKEELMRDAEMPGKTERTGKNGR